MLSGIRCGVCGKALEASDYVKELTPIGPRGTYWFNPDISDLHDEIVNFCGTAHATEWFVGRMAARTKGTEQTSNQT